MTVHERNIAASIDPVKLDRLAEVAIKVGLNLQAGQDLLLTAPSAALPLVRKIAEHAYKAGAGLVTPFLSDEAVTLSRYRFAPMTVSIAPPAGSMRGWRRRSPPIPPGLPSSATIRCCLRARIPPRSRAPQGQFDRLSAGAGKDRQLRHQLEHHRLSEHGLGEAGFPR